MGQNVYVDASMSAKGMWSVMGSLTLTNGMDQFVGFRGDALNEIATVGEYLIVDGLSFNHWHALNGPVVHPFICPGARQGTYMHTFAAWTVAGDTVEGHVTPIGVMVRLQTGVQCVGVKIDDADTLDTLLLTAWGRHFVDIEPPQAQPVSLEGIKWPLRRSL